MHIFTHTRTRQIFMGNYSSMVGAATFIIIFFGSNIVKHLGWKVHASMCVCVAEGSVCACACGRKVCVCVMCVCECVCVFVMFVPLCVCQEGVHVYVRERVCACACVQEGATGINCPPSYTHTLRMVDAKM